MLHPRINGTWVGDIGGFGDVSYSENWLHGGESAQWSMNPRTRHHLLKPGATVVIYEGPLPVWHGLLDEPGRDGTMTAYGSHTLGQGVQALTSGGVPTSNPQVAVAAAIARGAVPWTGVHGLNVDVGEGDWTLELSALLDRAAETHAHPWRINHFGTLVSGGAPTSPVWGVSWSDDLWSISGDDYVTHLNVYYMTGVETYSSYTYTTTEAAAAALRWGRKEAVIDLTGYSIITPAQANEYAAAALAQAGPRMTLSDSLTLGPGQLRTIGDQVAGWGGVHAGQMVRLWGVPDRSRVAMTLQTDFVIGRVQRDVSSLTLTPQGAPPRNAKEVIAAISKPNEAA